jgi:hypothetical protein
MFWIMLENSPKSVSLTEIALLIVSIAINAYGAYLFLQTDLINL